MCDCAGDVCTHRPGWVASANLSGFNPGTAAAAAITEEIANRSHPQVDQKALNFYSQLMKGIGQQTGASGLGSSIDTGVGNSYGGQTRHGVYSAQGNCLANILGQNVQITYDTSVPFGEIRYIYQPIYHPYQYQQPNYEWGTASVTVSSNLLYPPALEYQIQTPVNWQAYVMGNTLAPETPEQQAAIKAEQEKRKAASLRAESLLFSILTPAQIRTYTDDACFDVEINGREYRLHCSSRSGNVVLMEDGKPKFKYCAHPSDAYDVPIPDVVMSQLLMLRANEQEFLRIANKTVLQ